jgi:hypothetical protein
MTRIPVRIVGRDLPGQRLGGCGAMHVGLARGHDTEDPISADAKTVVYDLFVEVRPDRAGNLDYRGPYVGGGSGKGDRAVYLRWGALDEDGESELIGAAKLVLPPMDQAELDRIVSTGSVLQATVDLTDDKGGPVFARVPTSMLAWDVVPGDGAPPD